MHIGEDRLERNKKYMDVFRGVVEPMISRGNLIARGSLFDVGSRLNLLQAIVHPKQRIFRIHPLLNELDESNFTTFVMTTHKATVPIRELQRAEYFDTHYNKDLVDFSNSKESSGMRFATITLLEVPEYALQIGFAKGCHKLLKQDGLLLITTMQKKYYKDSKSSGWKALQEKLETHFIVERTIHPIRDVGEFATIKCHPI